MQKRDLNVGDIRLWPGSDYVEIFGKAERFTPLSDPPFFRFFIEVNFVQYEVIGCDQVIFMDKIISPVFWGISVKWETQPFVKFFGKKINDAVIVAYIVDVDINGGLQNWYYKSFLTKDERNHMAVRSNYGGKRVWVNGVLTVDDLLKELVTPNFERFQVPDSYLGKEAHANCTVSGAGGIGLVVENLFVEQNDSYIRIFP
jgi:hypothetical protein